MTPSKCQARLIELCNCLARRLFVKPVGKVIAHGPYYPSQGVVYVRVKA